MNIYKITIVNPDTSKTGKYDANQLTEFICTTKHDGYAKLVTHTICYKCGEGLYHRSKFDDTTLFCPVCNDKEYIHTTYHKTKFELLGSSIDNRYKLISIVYTDYTSFENRFLT